MGEGGGMHGEKPLTERRPVLRNRGFAYRYPVTFQIVAISTALAIFFSRPIYDIFFRESPPMIDISEPPTRKNK